MEKKFAANTAELILSAAEIFLMVYIGSVFRLKVYTYSNILMSALLAAEFIILFRSSPYKLSVFKRNYLSFLFTVFFLAALLANRIFGATSPHISLLIIPPAILVVRSFFILTGVFQRFNRLSSFFEGISLKPAQTILLSFLFLILTGALLLMLPFNTTEGNNLSFIDALFTATSAVCVTGLIVVDTAAAFTFWGKLVILLLIQAGGVGIMILSYFTIFSLKRKVSLEEKIVLSYMLNEEDMSHIAKSIRTIIYTSLVIEAAGTAILYLPFSRLGRGFGSTVFLSVFHSISAFCNAGFSLFSDSLEQFKGSIAVNMTIAALIILGGLSFAVINNLKDSGVYQLRKHIRGKGSYKKMQVNSKVVLSYTAVLLMLGMLFIYGVEHSRSLKDYSLGKQYLIAFFQSVTLRTAGFNTVSFAGLTTTTLLVMTVFMFIGAAAGSTAGGIKINNAAVIAAYIKSFLRNSRSVVLFNHSIPKEKVLKSMLILIFGITSVTAGITVLSFTEKAGLRDIIFETVSAFGTVGLSTGLTGDLTVTGKITISILMFMGRLGPLTILAAASRNKRQTYIQYPVGNISIG